MNGRRRNRGFTLVELMITLVLATLLLSLGVPAYNDHVERASTSKAIGDILTLSLAIDSFRLRNNDRVPDTLAELGIPIPTDPWGRPYQFLNIIDGKPNKGDVRKDGALNPLNSDFDLYSLGKDGLSKKPLNAKHARDDIVRANNGAFVGRAEDY
ncbi:MAG: prepilin-type N-terminal cleavage/methylation domain-containing protein [Woeseiaceae bacterium]|nr:prepilin-type N-terminal cleavage/methylation domain-containing protein [Woeseiaceae bacterium]